MQMKRQISRKILVQILSKPNENIEKQNWALTQASILGKTEWRESLTEGVVRWVQSVMQRKLMFMKFVALVSDEPIRGAKVQKGIFLYYTTHIAWWFLFGLCTLFAFSISRFVLCKRNGDEPPAYTGQAANQLKLGWFLLQLVQCSVLCCRTTGANLALCCSGSLLTEVWILRNWWTSCGNICFNGSRTQSNISPWNYALWSSWSWD